MDKKGLEKKLRELIRSNDQLRSQLKKAHDEIIYTWEKALYSKDRYTDSHVERTARYALIISSELDLQSQERINYYSVLLHDIGKVELPENLLNKPGKLTLDEYEIIKSHTRLGVKLLAPLKFMKDALSGINHHHERWDGKGYPDGLKGVDIPLSARILAIADAFDAMTTDRPYRKAVSIEIARDEIVRCAGSQFDPMLVDAFIKAWDFIAEIQKGRKAVAA
ncbi:MAG: HD domain-containing protein [Firmicutes bacterium]|nr:HD domain-containing protein [Bacillota bacterium]